MKQYNITKIQKKLRKELDDDRYRHTLGVMYTSAALAMRYGADLMKAQIAGLLHDCAKCIPNDKKLKLCDKYGIPVTKVENDAPFLLHSKLGAYLAKTKYGVEDEEILEAIVWHTTGKPAMTRLFFWRITLSPCAGRRKIWRRSGKPPLWISTGRFI